MSVARDFLWLVLGRLLAAVVALLAIRISTQILSPVQYGLLALFLSFQTFCGLFLMNPIGQYVNRHTHQWWKQGTFFVRMNNYIFYVLLVSFIGGALACIWFFYTEPMTFLQVSVISGVVVLMILAVNLNTTWIPTLNILGYRAISVLCATLSVCMGLLCAWLLTKKSQTAVSWYFGQCVGMALGAVIAFKFLKCHEPKLRVQNQLQRRIPLIGRKALKQYCLPLAVSTFFIWMHISGYRLVMTHYWGLEQVGYAVVGLTLAAQLWGLFETLALQFVNPIFLKRISVADSVQNKALALSDLINALGPIYLILATATLLTAQALLCLFVDQQYAAVGVFVMLGGMIELCRVLTNLVANGAQIDCRTHVLVLPNVLGSLVSLGLIVLIASMGMELKWAAVALVGSGLIMLLSMVFRVKSKVAFQLDYTRWGGALMVLLVGVGYVVLMGLNGVDNNIVAKQDFWFQIDRLLWVTLMSVFFALILLWKNPSVLRIFSISLKSD